MTDQIKGVDPWARLKINKNTLGLRSPILAGYRTGLVLHRKAIFILYGTG